MRCMQPPGQKAASFYKQAERSSQYSFFSKNFFTQWPKNIVNTYDFITIQNHALFYFGVFEWAGKGDVFIQE